MARIASNETDHRRGLVLGLTMAEVLILLLFVLLLASAAAITVRNRVIIGLQVGERERIAALAAIRPVVQALGERGLAPEQVVNEILPRLADLDALEAAARRIAPESAPTKVLWEALDELEKRRKSAPASPSATSVLAVVRDTERRLGDRLTQELGADLARWNAEIDPNNLTVRFNTPDLLFAPGEAILRPRFRDFMRELFPRYLSRLQEFRNDIEEVRIEGHTSTDWAGASSSLDAYFRNMALSQERTRAVLDFGLTQTALDPEIRDWAKGLITANGLSSSRLRFRPDGTENHDASRRVEFRVVLRLRERMMQVLPGQ